jgi:DNA helicase-2/ATP-dependent DNA helicase PcrA
LGKDWLLDMEAQGISLDMLDHLADFALVVRRWQGAVLLPIDQLVLTLAQDLFTTSTEMAIAHKMAYVLGRTVRNLPGADLPTMTEELRVIARNERRFLGFSEDDLGFDPENYKGRVVVSTMHKAKGLEWDRVYLMSVNNFGFPSAQEYDTYIPEKRYLRDRINLQAETMAQLEYLITSNPSDWYQEGQASRKDRLEYVRERLRLLYVGITRAKQELVITANSGQKGDMRAALPLVALQAYAREMGYGK